MGSDPRWAVTSILLFQYLDDVCENISQINSQERTAGSGSTHSSHPNKTLASPSAGVPNTTLTCLPPPHPHPRSPGPRSISRTKDTLKDLGTSALTLALGWGRGWRGCCYVIRDSKGWALSADHSAPDHIWPPRGLLQQDGGGYVSAGPAWGPALQHGGSAVVLPKLQTSDSQGQRDPYFNKTSDSSSTGHKQSRAPGPRAVGGLTRQSRSGTPPPPGSTR